MNGAIGVQTARARTGILTLFANAGLIARTIGGYDALGATVRRATDVIGHTGARGVTVDIAALRVGPARRGEARVRRRARQRDS